MSKLLEYLPLLMGGALTTVALAVCSALLATTLGLLGAWGKVAGNALGRGAVRVYTTLGRGIPDLVLILLVYFGGQRLINDVGEGLGLPFIEISKFWAGVAAIGVLYGAYLTETFRGAWIAVPRGQSEAARALGMPLRGEFLRVTGPQALRHALPGYGNVWLVLVKSTAVVSVIGLDDLVGLADKAGKSTREPFLFFVVVLLVYLAITAVSDKLLAWAERWANTGQDAGRGGGGGRDDGGKPRAAEATA
ncbi:ABC transporter permease [Albimonas pacifica]|uniref:Histidine transport system permease protein/arginine/ornithine transport system permease protein n=1 Tax=Albimonas pacifica TaxID=1114924 RepID=A0A1I3JWV9_9RHOB|nr:ABC transporter permease subunit [Albimonas pacifica]SFI64560.1 histidine transport system permease protein/arginine/ornithine transport system permease protein [Albimonas pacifica]